MARRKRIGGAAYMRLLEPMMKEMIGAIPKSGAGRKRRVRRRGAGFFGDMWDGIKSVGRTAAGILPINDILKGTHALSTGLAFVPGIGPAASGLARSAGYGRKKRRVKRVKGGSQHSAMKGGASMSSSKRQKGGYSYLLS